MRKSLFSALVLGVVAVLGLQSCVDDADDGNQPENLGELTEDLTLAPPTGLTVVNQTGTFTPAQTLNWTASAGAMKYLVLLGTAGPGSETSYTTCCTTGTMFNANHLIAATNYCWEVEAISGATRSAPSNEVCLSTAGATMTPPPTTVTATAVSSTRINVAWSSVTDATRYIINQSVAGGPYTVLTAVSAPTLAYSNINLTATTGYCYTVQAVSNAGGTSVVSAPPACDTTFALNLEGYWKFSESTGPTANDSSGFARSAALSGGAMFQTAVPQAPIDPATGNIEPYFNSGTTGVASTATKIAPFRLASDFSVVAWVEQNAAGSVAPIMGMRNAGVCGSGSGWEISQSAAGLAFIGQSGGSHLFGGQSLPVGTWTHIAATYTAGTLKLYINGAMVASSAYTAADSISPALQFGHFAGCTGAAIRLDEVQIYSRALADAEVATFGTRPPAPTALTLTRNVSAGQGLSWTPPASGADRWVILRAVGAMASGNETHYTHAPNPPNTFNASHLTPSTQYAWEVETVKNHVISLPSNEVLATTPAGPATPTGVTATANSSSRITVSWTAVTNATRYFVFIATSAVGPYTQKGSVASPAVSFPAIGLTASTTYYFEVQAEDAAFTLSGLSAPVSATTNP